MRFEAQSQFFELFHDLFEGFSAEVPDFEHVVLGASGEIGDGVDVGALQAVVGTDGEIEILHGHFHDLLRFVVVLGHQNVLLAHVVDELDEKFHMIVDDLRGEGDDLLCGNGAVGGDFDGELVEVDALLDSRALHRVVRLGDGGEYAVHGDEPDGLAGVLVALRGHISASRADEDLHIDLAALVEGADELIGVEHFHVGRGGPRHRGAGHLPHPPV